MGTGYVTPANETEEADVETKREDELDPLDETRDSDDSEREPLDPEDAEEAGFVGGSGGPAGIIYGEDDEADEHGDRLAKGPDDDS